MKTKIGLFLFGLLMLFTSCSTDDSSLVEEDQSATNDMAVHETEEGNDEAQPESEVTDEEQVAEDSLDVAERMIIHRANLIVNVKNMEEAKQNIEQKVDDYKGYVVDSSMSVNDEERVSGHLSVRIPEESFQQFLNDAEDEAAEVVERNVSGEDVTDEYVDIESRLTSKKTVEARLLEFMEEAEKTEDLLKISNDLADVQEEIEVLTGQQKFLENQTDFATIDITMNETRVIVPEIDNKDFDTWERTKKQFTTSTNTILRTISGLTVFVIGNFPIIIILLLVGGVTYAIVRNKIRDK